MSRLTLTKRPEPTAPPATAAGTPAGGRRGRGGRPAPERVPSVNLLSQWVLDGLQARRLRHRFQLAALVLAVAVLAAWWLLHLRVGEAEDQLAAERAETTRLTGETSALEGVRTYVGTVEQRKALVGETMTGEIGFAAVLEDLGGRVPTGVVLDTVAVTLTPPEGLDPALEPATDPAAAAAPADDGGAGIATGTVSACPGPDPFNTRVVVGCITLSGTADSRATVGDFVIALGRSKRFVEPFVSTTSTADERGVTFSGSVGLSERVFTRRYADMDRLLSGGPS